MLDAPYGEIMLLDHGELVDRAFTPNQTFLAGERVKPEEARLSWQAIQTRQPVILDDYATWPHRHPIYDQVPTHAVAIFPILKGDLCLGVFEFGRDQPNYSFSADQIQRGHLFARLAALAINNDQVYAQMRIELEARRRAEENAQRQARELSLLHIVRTALAREVDLADLLRTVVEAIAGTLGYTHVSVYLQHGTVLRMQHQVGYQQPILEFPMTQGIMARCVRNATTIFLPDIRTDPEYIGAMDGLASEICVPLFEQHNAVGALNVESTIGHSLTQADVDLLNSVGDQVNIAIGRARQVGHRRQHVEAVGETLQGLLGDALHLIGEMWKKVGIKMLTKPQTRENFRLRAFSGEAIMTAFAGAVTAVPTANTSPKEFAPTMQGGLQWSRWGMYVESKGKQGEKADGLNDRFPVHAGHPIELAGAEPVQVTFNVRRARSSCRTGAASAVRSRSAIHPPGLASSGQRCRRPRFSPAATPGPTTGSTSAVSNPGCRPTTSLHSPVLSRARPADATFARSRRPRTWFPDNAGEPIHT